MILFLISWALSCLYQTTVNKKAMVMKLDKFLCYMSLLAFLALTVHRRQ